MYRSLFVFVTSKVTLRRSAVLYFYVGSLGFKTTCYGY